MREIAEGLRRDRCTRCTGAEPSCDVLFRPEEIHRASGEDDVVPPVRGRDEAVEEELGVIDLAIGHLHGVRLPAVRTRKLDTTVDVEGIPSAIRIPPAVIGADAVGRGYRREWVRHPDLISRRIEHEGMSFMKAAPAVANLALIAQLARGRGTTELHERRVGPIAKGEQFRVDRPTLPPALWLAARGRMFVLTQHKLRRSRLFQCSRVHDKRVAVRTSRTWFGGAEARA